MGKITPGNPVKLFIGIIFKEKDVLDKAMVVLSKRFGKIDFKSQTIPFTLTNYYEAELGSGLNKVFISFARLIPATKLASIKVITNKIEAKFSLSNKRLINIDPGYLDLAKVILASTKDYVHRIYLGKGIYAELTLFYKNKSYQSWHWTYPDFCTLEYKQVFNKIRQIYAHQR